MSRRPTSSMLAAIFLAACSSPAPPLADRAVDSRGDIPGDRDQPERRDVAGADHRAADAPRDRPAPDKRPPDSSPDASTLPKPGGLVCSPDKWCWSHPFPHGASLRKVWGLSPAHLYVVGQMGTILHFDGTAWSRLESGVTDEILDIWGTGPSDLYVIVNQSNYGKVRKYDGTTWTVVYSAPWQYGSFLTISGAGGSIFVGGRYDSLGRIFRHNGTSWQHVYSWPTKSQEFASIWAGAASQVVAVGQTGSIARFDGTAWQVQTSGTTNSLRSVWGFAGSDTFAVGDGGTVLRHDGAAWVPLATGTNGSFASVWGPSPTSVYAAGCTFTGTGSKGAIYQYTGGSILKKIYTGSGLFGSTCLSSVGGSGSDALAVGGQGFVLRDDGSGWREISTRVTNVSLYRLWSAGPSTVLASGDNGRLLRRTASGWSEEQIGASFSIRGLWGTAANDLFAVGSYGYIFHFDGTAWTPQKSGTTTSLYAVWGAAADDVYAVGDNGLVLHYDGKQWLPMATGTSSSLRGVWGSGPGNVFAVGTGNAILRYDGKDWNPMTSGTGPSFEVIWGTSANNVYAGGLDSTTQKQEIWRYNGTAWSVARSVTSNQSILDLSGSGPNDIYAVGSSGLVLHWDGSSWASQASGVTLALRAVLVVGGEPLVVGDSSAILRRMP